MSTATLYVDGENWEIMGNVVDKFLGYNNTVTPSRSGRNFSSTEVTPKVVTVDEIKLDKSEFTLIKDFLTTCASKRFTVTLAIDEDCGDGATETQYLNCLITGEPDYSVFEQKITGFQFAYEDRVDL